MHHSSGEYVRYDGEHVIHTNTVENEFLVLKRGLTGVYQHCGEAHLHRYLSAFEFRYNYRTALGVSDVERTETAVEASKASAILTGGTVKPRTLRQLARKLYRKRKKA